MRFIFMSFLLARCAHFIACGNERLLPKRQIPEVTNRHEHTKYYYVHKYGDDDSPFEKIKAPKQNSLGVDDDYLDIKEKSQQQNLFTPSYFNHYHHHSFDDGDGHTYSFTFGNPPKSEKSQEVKPKKTDGYNHNHEYSYTYGNPPSGNEKVKQTKKYQKPKKYESPKKEQFNSYKKNEGKKEEKVNRFEDSPLSTFASFLPESNFGNQEFNDFEVETATKKSKNNSPRPFSVPPTYSSSYYNPEEEYVSTYPALEKDFQSYQRNKAETERYIYPTVSSYSSSSLGKYNDYVPPTKYSYTYPSEIASKYELLDKDIASHEDEFERFVKQYDALHDKKHEELEHLYHEHDHSDDEYLRFQEDEDR